MMRRLKEDVVADLPPKIVQDFACELTNVQLWQSYPLLACFFVLFLFIVEMQLYEAFTKSAEGQRLLTSIETDSSHSSANRTASNSSNLPVTYGARFGEKRYGFQALRYLQAAMDRVHRIGQRRVVSVYRLITQDSIEEQIMNLQAFKLHLTNTVITADNRSLSDMDTEHLFDRLTTSVTPPAKHFVSDSNDVDDLEVCYEKEYNLDEFILKLNQYNQ
ncbi:uncharacterized protein DEA37_0007236 [Paragonimus westermani]|uniref:SNF2 N-terminal domain-containing protein n=1 Tax=Paragonimus westermani TaxID=34504 RepID=A0A5J4N862_9TREM|nr:uncharacterized protein DEA37_0007236 [Paragonimus westermani]